MTDGEALLAAIIANPDDDTPRLVYADWLEENGQGERAEFIRVQIAQAAIAMEADPKQGVAIGADGRLTYATPPAFERHQELDRRAAELLSAHDDWDWMPDGFAENGGWDWERGFVGRVECTAAEWLAHGDAIRAAHPVTRVKMTTEPDLQVLRTGVYSLPGKSRWAATELGDNEQWRDVALRLLRAEWPGVTFELHPRRR